jgi:hypothetical protein
MNTTVETNIYYPTIESMFKVYVGVHDIYKNSADKIAVNIDKIIRVCLNCFIE